LKLTVAYDGTAYVGWQRQANGLSIQQLLEAACAPFTGDRASEVAGAGRTDAGVHAMGQVASVDVHSDLPVETLRRALNFRLPLDVRVRVVEDAPPDFHARFRATGKRYRYRIAAGAVLSPFDRRYVWHAPHARDVAAMRAAAAALVGTHDFSSFQSSGSEVADTIRTVRELEIRVEGEELVLEIEGDGFLRHMVRAIAGTLVDVAAGRTASSDMAAIRDARDRRAAGLTAPAAGLTLVEVTY
jgi:tRNA pseudouridine38-40 synthase